MLMPKFLNKSLTAVVILLSGLTALGQVDVARQTVAITYPLDEVVNVPFGGTTRFPRMKGEGRMRRSGKTGTQIELLVSKMPRPFELGAGYATYVLWAVSPEGQIDNLGEIKRRGFFEFDSKINVTTRLQTFALIVTAEPHYLVRRPSQTIMLENLSPYTRSGRSLTTTRSVQYFGNSSDYFRDARTPEIAESDYQKTPGAILQAIQAVALARYAGAERDAPEELQTAESQLKEAQDAWRAGKREDDVDIIARNAIGSAVKAENIAIARAEARTQRNEKTRVDEEIRQAEEKYSSAIRDMDGVKAELARETRARELLERDVLNFTGQVKDLRDELGKVRDENTRLKVDYELLRNRAEAAEAARADLEAKLAAALKPPVSEQKPSSESKNGAVKGPKEKSKQQNQDRPSGAQEKPSGNQKEGFPVAKELRKFGVVAEDATRVVLTLPETIWSGVLSGAFSADGAARIEGVAKVLAQFPEFDIVIESHTDDRGTPEGLLALSQQRADAIAGELAEAGIEIGKISARGVGAVNPLVPNNSSANRATNRRNHIFLLPKK